LLRFSLKRRNQTYISLKRRNKTYIIAGNTANTWRKISLKKLKINQKVKTSTKEINYEPNRKKINQTIAK